ncbi:hypothetical protein NKG94_34090 [Micromonospora sp. M12]
MILLLGALLLMAALSRRSGGPHDRALALVAPVPALPRTRAASGSRPWSTRSALPDDRPGDHRGHLSAAGRLVVPEQPRHDRRSTGGHDVAALPPTRPDRAATGRARRLLARLVGVHYPHDVIAGVLLGALVAAVATRCWRVRPARCYAGGPTAPTARHPAAQPLPPLTAAPDRRPRPASPPGAVDTPAASPPQRRRYSSGVATRRGRYSSGVATPAPSIKDLWCLSKAVCQVISPTTTP